MADCDAWGHHVEVAPSSSSSFRRKPVVVLRELRTRYVQMATGKRSSAVWDHGFERTGDSKATCTLCRPPKEFTYTGGTSNQRNHLTGVHDVDLGGDDTQELARKRTGGISSFFKPSYNPLSCVTAASQFYSFFWELSSLSPSGQLHTNSLDFPIHCLATQSTSQLLQLVQL